MSLNLLPSQAKFQVEKIRAVVLSRKILTIFLIIWVILVLGVFGYEIGEKWWLGGLQKQYQIVMSDYLKSTSEIETSQTIKFRAKLLGKVLADRFEYAQAFSAVGDIFGEGIKIKDFELKDRRFFLMSVVASDSESMKLLESRIETINLGADPLIKNIVIKSAGFTKDTALWLVTLEVYLK